MSVNRERPRGRAVYEIGHPVVLAHRGGLAEVPENSREAFDRMVDLGVGVLETDVRHTLDGYPVLAHDETLSRLYGDPRNVSSVPWDELSEMRDTDGAAPMLLRDLLESYPRLVVNIDAKTDEVVAPLLRDVREAGATRRVCLTAFSARRVATMARVTQEKAMIGVGMADVARLLAWTHLPGRAAVLASVGRYAGSPRAIQVPLTFRGIPVVTAKFVDAAHSAGHVVHVWTVNDPAEMHRLLDLGIDGIVTDVPTLATRVWAERGLAPA
ncbi:glycerophosphodiester phosphodiesterase family protein [Salana multivorans]|uniref:glycerophosphodiester phosphodiesterase family protein n=1 Tax=Salana multivorans TaxID=120377 RepID=UPI00249216C2|nr:glycerophosphodiester phosphodiesterase family protein [Salana multivorans]